MYLHPHTHVMRHRFINEAHKSAQLAWAPRADIREDAHGFTLLLDVPGVDPQAIEIEADSNVLSVRGERVSEAAAENEQISRAERRHGKFERRFALPETADTDAISASGRHGVLEIRIPKKAVAQPRKIQVQVTPLASSPEAPASMQ